ncbi:MAG: PhoH family protein [Clostridia bacterium]|nr:PhoH family protein [Clostridia bacterium]
MEKTINTGTPDVTAALFGTCDGFAAEIEKAFSVCIRNASSHGEEDALTVEGEEEDVEKAVSVLDSLKQIARRGEEITGQTVDYLIAIARENRLSQEEEWGKDTVCITVRGKPIKPKTAGQTRYVQAIRKNAVVFGVGPAGTGKTFLAVAMAVEALRKKEVSRIVLTRPAVEAGERLGFLPGDLQSKIDPYLRPLYDALFEMLGAETYARYQEKGIIEIAPLAYMRGRTLDDAFIILDEAQNTSSEQMKMFLTRLGTGSKAVVTGDPTQTDLPGGEAGGLGIAIRVLEGIEDIAVHRFTREDVVRHKLVKRIIQAYEKYEERKKPQKAEKNNQEKRK